ncbi:hypothetical protein G5I_04814 [Acromyrmex echinatior]|uniref:Uncharacterized protein n=1 Tax=Acromyrmex echinatior TaxID=103372 RepID=F4WGM9_ACREC|nr:hypothetical protein G5I_04814 [Acromyrmex echinatior]
MALTSRCRAGGGENLSEELVTEDEGTNGSNFEPLSDSCGESDMEGLDLSLFEPQVDTASWCDSRIHAGTLHILVHYCGAQLSSRCYFDGVFIGHARHEEISATAEIIRNEHVALIGIGSIKTRKLFEFDIPITPDVLTGCYVANLAYNQHPSSFLLLIDALIDGNNCPRIFTETSKKQKQFPSHLTSNYSACDRNRGWEAIELTDCRILYVHTNIMLTNLLLFHASHTLHHTQPLCRLTQRTHRLFRIQGRVEQWCGIDQPPKSGEAFCRSLNPNRHRNRWSNVSHLYLLTETII